MIKTFFLHISMACAFFFVGCTKAEIENPNSGSYTKQLVNVELNWRELETSLAFTSEPENFVLTPSIKEASGICVSHKITNAYWTHEDSGTDPKLYLYHSNGELLSTIVLQNIGARDYEDISAGAGPQTGNYLYLADIGDNNRSRSSIKIYRFLEPEITSNALNVSNIQTLTLQYPEAFGACNAEAFSVDPISGKLYVFTKQVGSTYIFSCEWAEDESATKTLIYNGEITINREQITASDISNNGTRITIKSYEYVYSWSRNTNSTVEETLQTVPELLPYRAEVQGEAFCWSLNGETYTTVSELAEGIQPKFKVYTLNK